jgi:hypothetical protein
VSTDEPVGVVIPTDDRAATVAAPSVSRGPESSLPHVVCTAEQTLRCP